MMLPAAAAAMSLKQPSIFPLPLIAAQNLTSAKFPSVFESINLHLLLSNNKSKSNIRRQIYK